MAVGINGATYEVRYDPASANTDITEHVVQIDSMTNNANEINTAVIQLNAEFGNFIVEANSGATPILTHWDKIKIEITDKDDNVYSRIFHVKNMVRKRTGGDNLRLEVHLVGQEFWLSKIPFSKPFYFENAFETVKDIVDIYNVTKGTAQCSIEDHDDTTRNKLPQWTANTNTWALREKMCWDGIMTIVDQLGQSVGNLGSGDFWAIKFRDKVGTTNIIEMEALSSGSLPVSPITLQNTLNYPISSIEEQFDSETATIVGVKAAKDFGSVPGDFSFWRGKHEAWLLLPQHQVGETYPSGAWVTGSDGNRYQSNKQTSATPPDSEIDWNSRVEYEWLGAIDYSPWTKGNVNAWQNSGSNPGGGGGNTGAYAQGDVTCNGVLAGDVLTVNGLTYTAQSGAKNGDYTKFDMSGTDNATASDLADSMHYDNRTGVTVAAHKAKGTSTSFSDLVWIQSDTKGVAGNSIDLTSSNETRLTTSAGTTLSGGVDPDFDSPGCFDANQAIHDENYFMTWAHYKATSNTGTGLNYKYGGAGGEYEGLRVLVNGVGSGDFSGFSNCVIEYDGSAWRKIAPRGNTGVRNAVVDDRCAVDDEGKIYKYDGSNVWSTAHTGQRANHCYHEYSAIGQSQGVSQVDDGTNNYGFGSAVKWTYEYIPWDVAGALPILTVPNYYSIGCWANLQAPFPNTAHNGQTIGSLYGGTVSTKQPSTFDANNTNYTPTGKNGFNETDSEELLPMTGLGFMIRLAWFYADPFTNTQTDIAFEGDFKFRVYMYDTSDNVVYSDFTISHVKTWTPVEVPFSSFKAYKARVPLTFGEEIITNTIVPELEVLDIFNYRDIKKIVIQCQESYDEHGRYKPEAGRFISSINNVPGWLPGWQTTIELEIDAFHFVKQLFSLSGTDTVRPIFKFLEAPHASNKFQTDAIATSQEEIEKFKYRAYDITMEGRCDIDAEDSFYLVDSEMINDNDDTSGGVKLVARNIEYSINASDGTGGFQTKITGVKRFT